MGGSLAEEYWDRPLDLTVSHDPGASAYVVRDEWRLTTAVGIGASLDGKHAFLVGLVPYVILDDQSLTVADCRNCSRVALTDYHERFGFSLVVGVTRLLN